ncbi:hypothetical protein Pmani_036190 [Petrolisthes manimaculis]|uniref:RNase H type-1 domain-containing protein n=1 Tax=Petrolisthes manimaculis TaxID=1843537 RepID=A0AAE1NJZ5_9EUCA|nr:hypothetical protein Pmani_036190 [Petrolisthes manimaculis]
MGLQGSKAGPLLALAHEASYQATPNLFTSVPLCQSAHRRDVAEGGRNSIQCLHHHQGPAGDGLTGQLGQIKTVSHSVHSVPQDSQEVFLLKHPLQETVREPPGLPQLRCPSSTPGEDKTQKAVEGSQLPLPSTPPGPPKVSTELSHSSPEALDVTRGSSGFCTMDPPTHTVLVATDASDVGWGLQSQLEHQACGGWSEELRLTHINYRELHVVREWLLRFPTPRGTSIRFDMDNSTAVSCIKRQGIIRSESLLALSEEIFSLAEVSHTFLSARYVPDNENDWADALSRFKILPKSPRPRVGLPHGQPILTTADVSESSRVDFLRKGLQRKFSEDSMSLMLKALHPTSRRQYQS